MPAIGRLLFLLALLGTQSSSAALREPLLCRDQPKRALRVAEFQAVLETVADAWNKAQPERAIECFTEAAVYIEPPDRQVYRGAAALRDFFAASVEPPQPDRMRWHTSAFDEAGQVGFGEYTYRGRQNYHGIAVLLLESGRIRSWREYQYPSALSWEKFVGPSR